MLRKLPVIAASQSFSARRRRNQVIICEQSGHAPDCSHRYRASVRLWRARSPMQISTRSTPRVDRKGLLQNRKICKPANNCQAPICVKIGACLYYKIASQQGLQKRYFCRPELRSTAVLREQMSFIHAGNGMNAAISFLIKLLPYLLCPEHRELLSLWHSRSSETLHSQQRCRRRNVFLHFASCP